MNKNEALLAMYFGACLSFRKAITKKSGIHIKRLHLADLQSAYSDTIIEVIKTVSCLIICPL